jgi:NAD(P)-dependent dehydrogenase (short-subunit alcohol dehydrogenase family)
MTGTSERLLDKRCIVTGGGTGIGRAVALGFAANGAHVVINGRREDLLDEVAAAHESIGAYAGDLTDPEAARRLMQHTTVSLGGLDVLFHAAGSLRRNERLADTSDDSQWMTGQSLVIDGRCTAQ